MKGEKGELGFMLRVFTIVEQGLGKAPSWKPVLVGLARYQNDPSKGGSIGGANGSG
jgi:hypothetical protein